MMLLSLSMASLDLKTRVPDERIAAVRRFNRFHTRLVGALNEVMLASNYSLPQVRILYEIANAPQGDALSAAELGRSLGLDPGYLSRLIAGLEKEDLILRSPARDNAKRLNLALTKAGEALFASLDAASAEEITALLETLSDHEQRQLVGAMNSVLRLLGPDRDDRTFILREPVPGDLGWITHRQAVLYAREYGFDWTFEALVADIVGKFVRDFDRRRENCWIADRRGEVVGSVFLVRQDDRTAKLRLLYVEPSARGLGLGRRLVEECVGFARSAGYRRMTLWTNDVLVAARRVYKTNGFSLTEEEPHVSFGKQLVGQTWQRDL